MRSLPLLLVACSTPALAQGTGGDEQGVSPGVLAIAAGPGTLDSPTSLLSAVELNASEEGTNGTIRLSLARPDRRGRFHTFSLTAGAALDSDTNTAFSALDPFATGAFLEGKYTFTQLLGRRRNPGARAFELCEDVQRRSGVQMHGDCNSDYIRANAPARYDEFDSLFFDNATVVFAGVSGRVGRDGFEFLDPANGSAIDETRTSWRLGGFLGFSNLPSRNSFSVEFQHQVGFTPASTAAVCPGGAGVTICPVGPVGPPTRQEQNLFIGEYRQRIGRKFAFAIRGSYETEGNVFQLDVPAYFISDGHAGLNAGVRVRYVHDPDPDDLNEGWVFGIFMSKSFSLFGG